MTGTASERRGQTLSDRLRRLVTSGVERALGGAPDLLEEYRVPTGDPGLFGPGSIAWSVHADLPAMIVGGVSSLMLQSLHPLAMAGVAEHSSYREDPFGRLRRTARFVAGTTFGGRPLAEQLVDEVRHVHGYVHGVAPDGRPYSADDPDLLTWVHTAEVWSFLRSYQRYGTRPLLRVEKDRYLDEVAQVARMLGARGVPSSVADVRDYFRRVQGELETTPAALDAVAFLRGSLGASAPEAVAYRIVTSAAVDLLPAHARRALGLASVTPVARTAVRATAGSLAITLRWAVGPSAVRAAATARALDAAHR